MTGQNIGELTVLGYAGSKFRGRASRASFFCRCSCGHEFIVTGAKLREGIESCGCASPFKRKVPGARARATEATKPSRPGQGARKRTAHQRGPLPGSTRPKE